MPEDADVGVDEAPLIEGIDEHRCAGGPVAADEKAAGLLQVGLVPGKEGHEGGRVEDALALQSIGPAGLGGEETVAHSECAGLQVA